jgi:hypothetical protein
MEKFFLVAMVLQSYIRWIQSHLKVIILVLDILIT